MSTRDSYRPSSPSKPRPVPPPSLFHRSGLQWTRLGLTVMNRRGCLIGWVVTFAILGVMFFLGMIVPEIVEILLS
jgi:hypothetical protein